MFKNKKKNKEITVANVDTELTLTDLEVRALLDRIDNGYTPSDEEIAALKKVERITFHSIPKSIDLLANLQWLDLSGAQIADLSVIKNLTNLQELYLKHSPITSICGIENLTNLQKLSLWETNIISICCINNLTNLQELDLSRTPVTSLSGIENLTNLLSLNLRDTQITSLSGIENLTNLQSLNLWGTRITGLSGIEKLTNLRMLSLSGTQITDLNGIEKLTKLQSLDLRETEIANLSGIENLTNLQSLDLHKTQISSICGIRNLTKLQELYLSYSPVTDISGIENLTNLQSLDLSYSPIANISGIENLTNLLRLYLSRTQIDSNELKRLPKLKNLRVLDLRHLKLTRIPRQLLELDLQFDTASEYIYLSSIGIFLYGTKLTLQPLSLFEQDRELIEEYYNSEMTKVGEAKVIFLGHGEVGKTHTIERIKRNGEKITAIEGDTPGIQITSIKDFDGTELNVQFWDFGGQDIMHSMHRCFLTERSCYVIVVNTRQGDVNKQARYWLNNIKSYAPNAPVILFENRWGKGHIGGGLDDNRLKKEFPNIRHSLSFSALEAEKSLFNGSLVKDIRIICSELDSVKMEFPKNWAKIREELLKLKSSKEPFIDKEKYYTLCQECGENSPKIAKWLLSWFNDLGVCLSYHQDRETHEELESYQLFAPNWIINAMYTIINNAEGLNDNGIIYRRSIKSILKEGSASMDRSLLSTAKYEDKIDYILEVMRKFRLSHKVSDTKEFIPALCDNNTPEDLHPTEWKKHITYKYVYPFLPDNVVHQMMLFRKQKGHQEPTKLWLKGFRIDFDTEGTAFVIDTGNDDNILLIDVYSLDGSSPYKQFRSIKKNIDEINERLGLSPYECISVEKNGIKQDLPVTQLRMMWDSGIRTYTILDQTNYAEIKLRDVLEGIIYPEELGIADRSDGSINKEETKTEAEKAPRNAGSETQKFEVNIGTAYFGDKSSLIDSSSTVNKGYTDEQMTKLFKIMFAHQDRITKEVLDTIAEMVERQGKQQPSLDADKIKEIITELKTPLPKTPAQKIQTCFDNIAKGWTMGKDILKWIIPSAIAQHAPEIIDIFSKA